MLPNIAAYNVSVGPQVDGRNTLRDFGCQRVFTGRSEDPWKFRWLVESFAIEVDVVEMGLEVRRVKHRCTG